MPYDLYIWEGKPPASLRAAEAAVDRRTSRFVESDEAPTPRLAGFVEALLERYPDISTPEGAESPWSSAPLMRWARGSFMYLQMKFTHADQLSFWVVEVAQQHSLNCYDPQWGQVRPTDIMPSWLTVSTPGQTGFLGTDRDR